MGCTEGREFQAEDIPSEREQTERVYSLVRHKRSVREGEAGSAP